MASAGDGRNGIPADRGFGLADNAEQLTLPDADERLPWLESDDDEVDAGVDTTRIIVFALVGLLAVAVLVGVLWWFTRDRPDPDLVAAGQTIQAPDQPYKERPENPGGTELAGTGDTSFAVAEGRKVEGYIAAGGKQVAAVAGTAESNDAKAAAAPQVSGVGVQVGAYASRATAEAGWQQLSGRLEPLQGRSHRVVEGTADSGTIYRLQAVAGSRDEAVALCHALRAAGGDCQVKR